MPEVPLDPPDEAAADTAEDMAAAEDRGVRAAAILMIVTIAVSAVTGLISNAAIANKFGVGLQASTYWQAFRIPSFVYFLIAGGALRTGFIPVFTTYVQQGEHQKAWRTFSVALTVMVVVSTVVVGLGMLLSGPLGRLMMSQEQGAAAQAMCGSLMRVMFPAQIFFLVGGLMQGTLNAMRHFWGPAIGPIIYNIAIIAATLGFAAQFGLYAPSAGVVVGAFLSTVPCCVPPLMRLGARYRPLLDLSDEGFRRVIALAAPIILGLAIAEVNLVITTALATHVADWGSAVLNNADRFAKLPMRMFGAGIAIAVYPTLALHAAAKDMRRFVEVLSGGIRHVMFLAIPSAAGLIALREPIMRLIYEHGEVTALGTHQMAVTLAYLAVGILGMSALQVVARAFYALQDTRTPVVVGVIAVAVCIGLSLALMYQLQVAGLAIATSVSNLANVGLLLWLLHRRIGLMDGRRLARSFVQVLAASTVMGVLAWLASVATEQVMGSAGMTARLATVVVGIAVGAVAFALGAALLRIEEARTALDPIVRRFRRPSVGSR
jgi:putative peptidoglycan lipid II flippase